ncbi:MAG: transposase [Candidatus Accumulibacter necessarius]
MHAQCWAHTRRGFFEAQAAEPEAAAQALALIGELYAIEEHIRAGRSSRRPRSDYRAGRMPSRSSSASSPGSMSASKPRVCCRAIR